MSELVGGKCCWTPAGGSGFRCGSASPVWDLISVLGAARRFACENRREPDLGFRCGSASPVCYLISLRRRLSLDSHAARRRLGVVCQWIQMRLGVSSLLPHLAEASSVIGFTCGSVSLGRRLSMDSDAARRLQFVTSSRLGIVCHWICMRLGVAWALSVNGFRCDSASLGRCLSLNLDAARRRCGDGL